MANDIEKLIGVFTDQLQEIETALLEVLIETRLANAVGAQLDVIGVIVKLKRNDLSDSDYRDRLYVRILINKSSGTIPEILEVIEGILRTDQQVTLTEYFPAAMVIRFDGTLLVDSDVLVADVKETRAGGVGVDIEYNLAGDEDTFTFATGDVAEFDDRRGFANDAGTTGGIKYLN